jgi:phage anti-repressor protein
MNITTLEQAAKHLIESGKVDMNTMTVEGKQLIEACGFSKVDSTTIRNQIKKHNLELDKDFMQSSAKSSGGRPSTIYQFTMNAANHILLAAMTDKGKKARQQAINLKESVDSVPVEMVESFMADMAAKFLGQTEQAIAQVSHKYEAKVKEKDQLIYKKSEPISLTKILGNSHKVVQATNLWLEENEYQEVKFEDGKRKGWSISDKGRELGTQISKSSIYWVPEIKKLMPKTSELLEFAERLGLKDMTQQKPI